MHSEIPLRQLGIGELMAPGIVATAVIIGGENVTVDAGALHRRSRVEAGVTFLDKPDTVPNGRRYAIVWAAIKLDEQNQPQSYHGLGASEMRIDHQTNLGYKNLSQHVNQLFNAVKGAVNLDVLKPDERRQLRRTLESLDPQAWSRSPEGLKQAVAR